MAGDPQPGFSLAWRGPDETGQPTVGSPIVVAGAVWNVDFSGRVMVMDGATGTQRYTGQLPGTPGHFASLAYGGGQVYAATPGGVAAFQLVGLTQGG
jgi:outer membrane protein assembly factor BamB